MSNHKKLDIEEEYKLMLDYLLDLEERNDIFYMTSEQRVTFQQYIGNKMMDNRKHGKWIKVHGYATPGGDPGWCCSECGKGLHVYGIEHGTYGEDIADHQWLSCPNCDTLMDGETWK